MKIKINLCEDTRLNPHGKAMREKIINAETEEGALTGEVIIKVVENQINDNDPPETKQTLNRLIEMGESRENAMRYIARILAIEIFEIMKNKTPYNEKRYLKNLKAPPKLPQEMG